MAIVVGVVFNRFRDDIFVLVSFGFAIIAFNTFLNLREITRGAFGIHEVEKPAVGGWVIDGELEFLILFWLVRCSRSSCLSRGSIVTSSFGRVLTAIREDEQAIAVFGYRVTHYKLADLGDLGDDGGPRRWALRELDQLHRPQLVHPAGVDAARVAIVILGGLATIWGSLLGAMAFVLLEEGMRFLPFIPPEYVGQARQIVLGVLLVLLMLFRPQGLVGRYRL